MANEEQREYWTEQAGPKWVEFQARLDAMLEPVATLLVDAIDAQQDERILDVGCGTGELSRLLAERGAVVTGIDISTPMIEAARARVSGSAKFEVADASEYRNPIPFDCAASRFGVMFFEDPAKAFATIRGNLSEDGRLVFACWRAPDLNPWAMVPAAAVIPLIPDFEPPDPDAPGPFAFADRDRIESILSDAGYDDIQIAPREVRIGLSDRDIDDATDFACQIGPGSRAMAVLDDNGRAAARDAIRAALAAHVPETGPIAMDGAIWLVSATL